MDDELHQELKLLKSLKGVKVVKIRMHPEAHLVLCKECGAGAWSTSTYDSIPIEIDLNLEGKVEFVIRKKL